MIVNPRRRMLERIYYGCLVLLPAAGACLAVAQLFLAPPEMNAYLLCAVFLILSLIGLEVGYHRHFIHRSFETVPILRIFLVAAGSMGVQGPLLFWGENHVRHHPRSDREDDVHSPYKFSGAHRPAGWKGFLWAHFIWFFHYDNFNWTNYPVFLRNDALAFQWNRTYNFWVLFGFAVPALLGGLLSANWQTGALNGLLWGGFARLFLVQQIIWCQTSVLHMFGSQEFATRDQSRNNALVALISGGLGWHNNHHAFPAVASLRFRPHQFDLYAGLIWLWEKMGLAWNVKRVTPAMLSTRALSVEQNEQAGTAA